MNIKFKDTLIKENLLAWLMVLCALTCGVLGLFCPPINWTEVVWVFAAAITAFDLVLVNTIRLCEKRELKQDLQHSSEYIAELEARVDDLRKQRSDYAAKAEDAMGQLQALDNEYLKLAKQHNDMSQDLSKLQKKYDDLAQVNDIETAIPTNPPKPKKTPTTGTSKKAKYTKKDVARIHEEMKVGGMIKEKEEE